MKIFGNYISISTRNILRLELGSCETGWYSLDFQLFWPLLIPIHLSALLPSWLPCQGPISYQGSSAGVTGGRFVTKLIRKKNIFNKLTLYGYSGN